LAILPKRILLSGFDTGGVRLAVGSWQLAVDGWQLAVGSWSRPAGAVGSYNAAS